MPGVKNFGASEYSEQIRENACQRGGRTAAPDASLKKYTCALLQCNLETESNSCKLGWTCFKLCFLILVILTADQIVLCNEKRVALKNPLRIVS